MYSPSMSSVQVKIYMYLTQNDIDLLQAMCIYILAILYVLYYINIKSSAVLNRLLNVLASIPRLFLSLHLIAD